MKNPLATLACCVALVAALSPVFSTVLTAAVAGTSNGHGPAAREEGGHCSWHEAHAGGNGGDESQRPADRTASRN